MCILPHEHPNKLNWDETTVYRFWNKVNIPKSYIDESKESAEIFVDHIKSHLKPGENVICKMCGKTVEEIYLENKHP